MKNAHSTHRYRNHLYRAIAIACMIYGVTLIANTAAAATVTGLF